MKMASLSLLATILCMQICFAADPVSIRGTLTITGESDARDVELQARYPKSIENTGSLGKVQPGTPFALQTHLTLPVVVLAQNEVVLAVPERKTFLYGYSTLTAEQQRVSFV